MSSIKDGGASDTDDPGQSGVADQNKESLPAGLEKMKRRRESAVIDDQATVPSRDNLASPPTARL